MRTPLCDQLGIEFPIFAFTHCRDVVAAVEQGRRLRRARRRRLHARAARDRAQLDRRARRRQALRRRHRDPRQVRGHGRDRPRRSSRSSCARSIPARAPRVRRRTSSPSTACPSCPRARPRRRSCSAGPTPPRRRRSRSRCSTPKVQLIANALGTPPDGRDRGDPRQSGRLVAALCGAAKQALHAQGRRRRHRHRAGHRGRRPHRRDRLASCCGPR